MPTADDPFRRFNVAAFFHFTDLRNLPTIRKAGGLFSRVELQKRKITVPFPGGNDWSKDADQRYGLDRYVHLCLFNDHPMEYLAKRAKHIGDTIFLQIDPSIRLLDGVLYSPGVSNKADVGLVPMAEGAGMIDFPVIYTNTDWNDPVIKGRRKIAKKCEILVPDHIPARYIRNLGNG